MVSGPSQQAVRFQSDDGDAAATENVAFSCRPSMHAVDPDAELPRPLSEGPPARDDAPSYLDGAGGSSGNGGSGSAHGDGVGGGGGGGGIGTDDDNTDPNPYAAAASMTATPGSRPTRPLGPTRTPSNTYAPARRPPGAPAPAPAAAAAATAAGGAAQPVNDPTRSVSNNRPRASDRFKAQEKAYVQRLRQNPTNAEYFDYSNANNSKDGGGGSTQPESDSEDETPSSEGPFDDRYNQETIMFYDNDDLQPTEEDILDPSNRERLEWHSMLETVMLGDVVRQEKKRIIGSSEPHVGQSTQKMELWLGIRAKACGRSLAVQRRLVDEGRAGVDRLLDEVISFEIKGSSEVGKTPYEQVKDLVRRLDRCERWYPSWSSLTAQHKATESPAFLEAYDAIVAWHKANELITMQLEILRKWVGNDELDLMRTDNERCPTSGDADVVAPPHRCVSFFLDRLTKDKNGLQTLFQQENEEQDRARRKDGAGGAAKGGRLKKQGMLVPLMGVITKVKQILIRNHAAFQKRHLPQHIEELLTLVSFPSRLIGDIIKMALANAHRVRDSAQSSPLMHNQMTEEFQLLLKMAIRIQHEHAAVAAPEPGWELPPCVDEDHDLIVLEALKYYFKVLNWKLRSNRNTFKEAELLFQEWDFANGIGRHLRGGDFEVAEQFSSLIFKSLSRVSQTFEKELQIKPKESVPEMTKRYKQMLDSVRVRQRMLQRFSRMLSNNYEHCCDFSISFPADQLHNLYERLLESGHVRVRTEGSALTTMPSSSSAAAAATAAPASESASAAAPASESASASALAPAPAPTQDSNIFVFASSELRDRPEDIRALMAVTSQDRFAEETGTPYLLVIRPEAPPEWFGAEVSLPTPLRDQVVDLKRGHLRLCACGSQTKLDEARSAFLEAIDMHLDLVVEQRANLHRLNNRLTETRKVAYRLSNTFMDSVEVIRAQTWGKGCQELIQTCFVFATDFGQRSLLVMDHNRRQMNNIRLTNLALDWLSFICDDCIASEGITFKWAVLALEFAMIMTRGRHMLALGDQDYDRLRAKVAGCMKLLVSHFDIMGARSAKADQLERQRLEDLMGQFKKIDRNRLLDDDEAVRSTTDRRVEVLDDLDNYRHEVQGQTYPLGRVLKVSNEVDRSLAYLSSAATTVTMRWQQGACVGGGTFGQVFSAVDLETGRIMAVKEIRLQDPKLIPSIAESIREEMSVLSLLDHPNVVSYYGIEVHREKVCIFMEFCSGGSLASLLEHGRIEDEQVIMVYALQLLEGLAYLHESGIVHRDIKPENILLDHNGIIKYVDFGAAKVIARQGRTLGGGILGGDRAHQSMTGTPMYMSPESINGDKAGQPGAVDIWSLGCVILEMATGRRPWSHLDNEFAVMYSIAQGNQPQLPTPDQLSPQGVGFLKRCLVRDAEQRATAVELLQHEWIVTIRNQVVEPSTPSDVSSGSAQSTPISGAGSTTSGGFY